MKLILALGNPGSQYAQTRHNVGWQVIDAYAQARGVAFAAEAKFFADVAELSKGGEKFLLVKPTTYYNEAGRSARAVADFYKVEAEDVLVVHDELALDFGVVRTRRGGSDAGNKGVRSITAHLGENTARLRIGTNREQPAGMSTPDFVLSRLSAEERVAVERLVPRVAEIIDGFVAGEFEARTER